MNKERDKELERLEYRRDIDKEYAEEEDKSRIWGIQQKHIGSHSN